MPRPRRPRLVTENYFVPATDPGIQLSVRNKRPEGVASFPADRSCSWSHGATYPGEPAFDLLLGGVSWMDYVAQRGFDVYLMNVRGYGLSTRPPQMSQPPKREQADRPHRGRRQGRRCGRRSHPGPSWRVEDQPAGLVLGHRADRRLHRGQTTPRSSGSSCTRRPSSGRRLRRSLSKARWERIGGSRRKRRRSGGARA